MSLSSKSAPHDRPNPLLDISLLELIYQYPAIGSLFHDYPTDFITTLRILFIRTQEATIDNL